MSRIDYYVAFGYWKLACIVEGVYARYVGAGAMGRERSGPEFDVFAQQVEMLAQAAAGGPRAVGLTVSLYEIHEWSTSTAPLLIMAPRGGSTPAPAPPGPPPPSPSSRLRCCLACSPDTDSLGLTTGPSAGDGARRRREHQPRCGPRSGSGPLSDGAGNDVLPCSSAPSPTTPGGPSRAAAVDLAPGLRHPLVLGPGAYPAPVPHTRPRCCRPRPPRPRARPPGGTTGVNVNPRRRAGRHRAPVRRGGPPRDGAVGAGAHYAAAMPHPAAVAALLDGLATVGASPSTARDLHDEAVATKVLTAVVAESDEHEELVAQLEAHVDAQLRANRSRRRARRPAARDRQRRRARRRAFERFLPRAGRLRRSGLGAVGWPAAGPSARW